MKIHYSIIAIASILLTSVLSLSTIAAQQPTLLSVSRWVDNFGYDAAAGSWRIDQHPRTIADVNGDGKADIVGFGNRGVYVSLSTGTSFNDPQIWVDNFGYTSDGWRNDRHLRVLADVNGDGKADVVGFGNEGVYVSVSTGSAFSEPQVWVNTFGYNAGGWRIDQHPRMLADVNGDGKADVVGFGNEGVYVSVSTGSAFSEPQVWVNTFGNNAEAGAWRNDRHLRTLADMNGDGKADVVGFWDDGVYVAMSTGSSFAPMGRVVDDFGYTAGNWRIDQHPRMLADVNGDDKADIVGFGDRGVYVSLSTGTDFSDPQLRILDYGYYAGGWRTENNPRIMADVNNDAKIDIVGFGNRGVYVSTDLLSPPPPPTQQCVVPFFSQRDPRWANHPLRTVPGGCGYSCNTIGKCGCTLTSVAMVFRYYGANLNPASLSDCMGTSACPFYWGTGASCSGGKASWSNRYNFSWGRLEQEVKQSNHSVILGMTRGNQQHWVVVLSGSGTSTNNYRIHDPWPRNGANMRLSAYNGWSFRNIAVYSGQPSCARSAATEYIPPSFHIQSAGTTAISEPQQSSAALTLTQTEALSTSSVITGTLDLYQMTDTTATVQLSSKSTVDNVTEMVVWTDTMSQTTWQPFSAFVEVPIGEQSEKINARFRDANGNTSDIVSDTRYPNSDGLATPRQISPIFLPMIRR
jgi:hypothetical protein